MNSNNRLVYLDLIRIIATIATIVIHVSCMAWNDVSYDTKVWEYFNLYNGSSRFSVPCFVMISGALNLGHNKSIKYAIKKSIRFLTNFFIWTLIYIYWSTLINPSITFLDKLNYFICGYGHLWYLWLAIGLYLLNPILELVIKDKPKFFYFLILLFSFTIVGTSIYEFVKILIDTNILENSYCIVINEGIKGNLVNAILMTIPCYVLYYYVGYALNRVNINKRMFCVAAVIGMFGGLTTTLLSWYVSQLANEKIIFYGNYYISVFCESISLFIVIKSLYHKFNMREKGIIFLADHYYGIYLIHPLIVELIKFKIGFTPLESPYFTIPFITLMVFLISLAVSYILKKIPMVQRIIL